MDIALIDSRDYYAVSETRVDLGVTVGLHRLNKILKAPTIGVALGSFEHEPTVDDMPTNIARIPYDVILSTNSLLIIMDFINLGIILGSIDGIVVGV